MKTYRYRIEGIDCPACELELEKKILENFKNVISVRSSRSDNSIEIATSNGNALSTAKLNRFFQKDKYIFVEELSAQHTDAVKIDFEAPLRLDKDKLVVNIRSFRREIAVLGIIAGLVLLYMALQDYLRGSSREYTGIDKLISGGFNLNRESVWLIFFAGIVAGVSSCASIVGALMLSLSRRWQMIYGQMADTKTDKQSRYRALYRRGLPLILFNIGRIVSFAVLGGLLGAIGSLFNFSQDLSAVLVLLASFIMLILGAQMYGIKLFNRYEFKVGQNARLKALDDKLFKGYGFPLLSGALTFLIPCGFTAIAQSLAIVSGSALNGAIIMAVFALGTLPALLAISAASLSTGFRHDISTLLERVVGGVVVLFALENIFNLLEINNPRLYLQGQLMGMFDVSLIVIVVLALLYQILQLAKSGSYTKYLLALCYFLFIVRILSGF